MLVAIPVSFIVLSRGSRAPLIFRGCRFTPPHGLDVSYDLGDLVWCEAVTRLAVRSCYRFLRM